jgi:hypothetical protein
MSTEAEYAHAVGGLDTTATTTYTVDFPAGVVHGRIDFGFVNAIPDRPDGNQIASTHFNGFQFGLPGDAANVIAGAGERPLAITVTPADNFQLAAVDFGTTLDYGEHLDMVVTFDLPGYAPRRPEPLRASEAFVSFVAWAYGDRGAATVRIVTPAAADVAIPELATGSSPRPRVATFGDTTVRTFPAIRRPQRFGLFVTAADDRQLVEHRLEVGGQKLVLQAWPDDPRWSEFMIKQVSVGLPVLAELIGRPLPDHSSLYLRESANPGLEGYSGWFDYTTGVVEMGEQLDPIVTMHELSHGWFDNDTSEHRWITEGLAETYANVVVKRTGGRPRRPERPATNAPGRRPLNDWESFDFSHRDEEVETYGYAASFYVVDSLLSEIGPKRMARVLAAIDRATPAYENADRVRKGPASWRRFLDLLEEVGGSERATRLFRHHVVTDVEAENLDARRAARKAYAELVERADGWAPPARVDQDMERWDFVDAEASMLVADDVVSARDEFLDAAADTDVELPRTFGARFEKAARPEALEAIAEDIAELDDALGVVLAADAAAHASRDTLEVLALGDEDFAAELAEARDAISANEPDAAEALARRVQSALADAESVGRERATTVADTGLGRPWILAAAAGAGLVLGGLLALAVRRRRRRRAGSGDVAAHLHAGGNARVDGDVEPGVGARLDLDEDALSGTGLGGVDRSLDAAARDTGEGTGATRVVERQPALGDVGDSVLELGEDVGAVVDAQPVARAEVLIDPDTHAGNER